MNLIGALIETVPAKPPVEPVKNPTTTQSRLVVDYRNLTGTANGGATILAY